MRRTLCLVAVALCWTQAQVSPDLAVVSLNTAGVVTDSQTLAVSGTLGVVLTNTGAAAAASTVRVFEDRNGNAVFDAGDVVLGTGTAPAMNASTSGVVNVTLAGTLQFAGNILYAQADSGGFIAESNEANNLRHTGQTSVFSLVGGALNPVVLWQRSAFAQLPASNQVTNTPAVGDLDADGVPEIVFSTYSTNDAEDGVLRAVDGRDGSEKLAVTNPAHQVDPGAGITLADIDLDGRPEILTMDEDCRVISFEHDGSFKWRGAQQVFTNLFGQCWGAVSVADLDRNGSLEIIAGRYVYTAAGALLWQGSLSHVGGIVGPLSAVADLDLDGNLEVVAGATAYRASGAVYWDRSATFNDAAVAVANLDADAQAEIVFKPRLGFEVVALEHDGTTKWTAPWAVGPAGAPTIGNFDSDPEPEIGIAGPNEYRVYEANGTLKWSVAITDPSSGISSASLFDFNNDGAAEVVFGDEQFLYIWRGSDGAELFKTQRFHPTAVEMPIVADVDADGHADIVVPRADNGLSFNQGIVVYRGANNNWANTRRLWSQPVYSITHINDNFTVPTAFPPNWQTAGLNNFRLNAFVPGTGSANSAADLTVSFLRRSDSEFPAKTRLTARAGNGGAAGAAQTTVRFTLGIGGATLCEAATTLVLTPGQFQDVTCEWLNPVAGTQNIVAVIDPAGAINEGNETNNTATAALVIGLGPAVTVDDLTVRSRDAAIDLKWTPVPGAASYNIYRRTATGAYTLRSGGYVNTLGAFADTGLTNNTVYWYNVRWLNSAGVESALGTEGSATPIPRTQRNDTAPTITSTPQTRGRVLTQYRYLPVVADPDAGDTKLFALVEAPSGLTINSSTGEMLFTPTALQGGTHRVHWNVADSRGRVTSQAFNLFIETQMINQAPVIISTAITSATAGRAYAYTVRATDPDAGDLVTFALDTAPAGMDINATTGLITWLPLAAQVGTHPVVVRARDIQGFSVTQSFSITVTNPNRQPLITSTAPASVIVGNTYSYPATATDPDADVLTWSIPAGPSGATINSSTGLLLFTPTATGPVNFTIRVTDVVGAFASQSFTVQVNAVANANPAFTSTPVTAAETGALYSYQATATDPDGQPVAFSLIAGPSGMTVTPGGLVQWTPSSTGTANVTLRAADNAGGSTTQAFVITVAAADTTPPAITFTTPSPNASVSGDVTIIGSVTDANLVSWRSEYQVPGATAWTPLASGTTPVTNGSLGVLPASLLADNPYNFRVSAFDRRQGFAATLPLRVEGGQVRLGQFTLDYVDFQLPALQMPVKIRRHYDSTKPHVQDFGTGWALAFADTDLRVDAAFNVFLTLPNGRRVSFQFAPFQPNPLFPALTNNYVAAPGQFDTLENLDCNTFLGGGSTFVCATTLQAYAPRNWRLTTRGGVVYTIEGTAVKRIEDRNGNWTNISPTGITTSSNRNVAIVRDPAGRITQITDGRGKRVLYVYDAAGRLIQTTDQENRVTGYAYSGNTHLITRIDAPGGCQPIRTEFDSSGRVTAKIDASGARTEYTYDLPNRRTTTLYPGGVTTVETRDAAGNLISFVDGRGLTYLMTYDAGGRRLTTQLPSGRILGRTYDANGSPATEYDGPPGGPFQTTSITYNPLNLVDRITRPNGDYQTHTYDARGNLTALRIFTPAGVLAEEQIYTYDSTGKLITARDRDGAFTYAYDANGNPQQRIDGSLRSLTIGYDALGNPVSFFDGLGRRSDGEYDGYGNLSVYKTNNLLTNRVVYNEYGLPTSLADGLNNTYSYTYNCSAYLTRVTDPNAQQMNYVRSTLGYLNSQTDALSRVTSYTYNGNGAETLMTSPAGDTWSTAYTPDNQVSSTTTGSGTVTRTYDAYGRLQTETLPTATIAYTRDSRGRATSIVTTGANAGTHTEAFDAANRLVSATDRFGRTVAYTYDVQGRRTSLTAPDGSVTNYTYDAGGKIQRITTGADYAEYTYDLAGRKTQLLYSNGIKSTYFYDSRGRITTQTWLSPTNSVIRSFAYSYDAASRPVQVTLNDGTITRTFDALGRLTSENIVSTLWGNRNAAWTYDVVGNRLDAGATFGADHRQLTQGASTFTYTAAGNQTASGGWGLTYDAHQRNTGVTYAGYTFDHRGRRNEVTGFEARRMIYDEENILQIEVGGSLVHRYTHGLQTDELLFVRTAGNTLFFLTDHQGSVLGLANSSGTVIHQHGYDAWGQLIYTSVPSPSAPGAADYNPFYFQGREYERFAQLYHYRAREYAPAQGRFLQKDPVRGSVFLPMARHPYLFLLNQPVTYTDPLGRDALSTYEILVNHNQVAEGGAFGAGFSVGYSGATFAFVGFFLDGRDQALITHLPIRMQISQAAMMADSQIGSIVRQFEQLFGGSDGTNVGRGLSEGATLGNTTFLVFALGL